MITNIKRARKHPHVCSRRVWSNIYINPQFWLGARVSGLGLREGREGSAREAASAEVRIARMTSICAVQSSS